jgi:hypothetical protein
VKGGVIINDIRDGAGHAIGIALDQQSSSIEHA